MSSMKPPAPGQVDSTAAGGMTAPPPAQPTSPGQQATAPMPSPDDTPMLTGETLYPDEPITTGLPSGPGAGPPNLFAADTQKMQRYLPLLRPFLDRPEVPDSVRMLYRFIRSS